MNKNIPYTFDCVPVSSLSPIVSGSADCENIGRMNVGVFTRYGNRNGSYITDQYAEYLIGTAIDKPVVGFFDRESQDWQGHVGPTLASAYGYVDHFVGWQPFADSDGVEREYAVFSVVLFSDYFEEARHIMGKSQSMELDPQTIEGDWADIEGQEYFVYTTGKMAGFCILGDSKEPCFSASSFFEKEDAEKTQFEKFSSLLFELKAKVEEAEKSKEGGEHPMEENMIQEPVVETPAEETPVVETQFEEAPVVAEEQPVVEENQEPETTFEETEEVEPEVPVEEPAVEPEVPAEEQPSEFEVLQNSFNELQENYTALQTSYSELQAELEAANGRIVEFETNAETVRVEHETQINALTEQLNAANARIQTYESAAAEAEEARKTELVSSYEKIISEEEIAPIKAAVADFSYDELESKLAVTFSRNHLKTESNKVPLAEPEESAFAALIKKYKR